MAIGDGGINAAIAVILFDLEGTPGTPATLTGSNAILVEDFVAPGINIEKNENNGLVGFGTPLPKTTGNVHQTFAFKVPWHGSGAAATPIESDPIRQVCGLTRPSSPVSSVPYTPDLDVRTGTIKAFVGGKLVFEAAGVAGKMVTSCEGVGKPIYDSFELMGTYIPVADAVLPGSLVYDANEAPVFMGASVSFGGDDYCVKSFSLDYGSEVQGKICAGATYGYKHFRTVRHLPTGSLVVEADLVADADLVAEAVANTDKVLDMTIGAGAGNILDIDAPKCRILDAPYTDEGKILQQTINFQLCDSSGNDFLTQTTK